MKEYTIDAAGKKPGRLCTEVAVLLRGKNSASFEQNIVPNVKVVIINASQLVISPDRASEVHSRFSGYPSGLIQEKKGKLIDRKGMPAFLMRTIKGMLPKNTLRAKFMKNISVTL